MAKLNILTKNKSGF